MIAAMVLAAKVVSLVLTKVPMMSGRRVRATMGTRAKGIPKDSATWAQGRLGSLSARGTALTVAAGGFLAVYVLPGLKYPGNPPGTSSSETITDRTQWYFVLLVISLVVVIGATVLARALAPRLGSWNAALLAALGGVVAVGLAYAVLPVIDETPADFRADALWQFRIASGAIQLTLWATLGLVFGVLTERALRTQRPPTPLRDPATPPPTTARL